MKTLQLKTEQTTHIAIRNVVGKNTRENNRQLWLTKGNMADLSFWRREKIRVPVYSRWKQETLFLLSSNHGIGIISSSPPFKLQPTRFTVPHSSPWCWSLDGRLILKRLVESSVPNVYWDVESETGRGGGFETDWFPAPSQCWSGRQTRREYHRPVRVYRHWWSPCPPNHHQTENVLPNMERKFPVRSASRNQLRPDCVSRCSHTTRWFCGQLQHLLWRAYQHHQGPLRYLGKNSILSLAVPYFLLNLFSIALYTLNILIALLKVNLEPQGKIHLVVDLEQGVYSSPLPMCCCCFTYLSVLILCLFFQMRVVLVEMKSPASLRSAKDWTDDVEPCDVVSIKSTDTSSWLLSCVSRPSALTAENSFGKFLNSFHTRE